MAEYRVLLYATSPAASGGFGPGALLAEFDNVKNIGWERHLNEVGSAFWTINQDDPKLAGLRPHKGKAHAQIVRDGETIWRGVWGETDAQGSDVIFYAHGYEGLLYSLLTDWNVRWSEKSIGTIVTDLWTHAKTTLSYSPLGFVTTGTIQAPATTNGGSTAIVLPLYRTYHKRILFALRELATLGTSDTTNTVYFELAPNKTPTNHAITFNFWKNRSTDRTNIRWEYPNGLVRDFTDAQLPVLTRNDLPAVGSAPNDLLLRERAQKSSGATGYEAFGRRMEPLFFSWVRDEAELQRVLNLRLARAVRSEPDIRVFLHSNAVPPPGSTAGGYELGDRVSIKLKRGLTDLDQMMFISGVQVISMRGREVVMPWLMDRSGS